MANKNKGSVEILEEIEAQAEAAEFEHQAEEHNTQAEIEGLTKPLDGDEVQAADDVPTTKIGGMRFVPIRVAALVLERSSKATGLSPTDIINVSLVLFQNASRDELQQAISSLNADKAEALFNSLK